MKIENIKKLSSKVNQVTRTIDFTEGYFSLLNTLMAKENNVADKAMTLYLALENDGMLSLIQENLKDMSEITNEADDFIFKVSEELESKKLMVSNGGSDNEK